MTNNSAIWNSHYIKNKSNLIYPDETLVRLFSKTIQEKDIDKLTVLDLGCGSGRHMVFTREMGIHRIIGVDFAKNACVLCKEKHFDVIQCNNTVLPFKNNSFDIIISWGSLHYSYKKDTQKQIAEIHRILKPNGVLLGTLRSNNDTMLRKGENLGNNEWKTSLTDIDNSIVSFFSEDELIHYFSSFNLSFGIVERTVLGNMNQRISHWYYSAEK